ncbi:hypothetical protein GQ43DRAFT_412803 [Delitschia confertaspora ATCC 74209]|uniref:U6 snRNA phosphodiesterase n=1 Tax=Delitschia confertaspora ATCC 74209 TaxID=1513339 RepID=A0A9P4JP79_9PLEO|nr:hypothetical protein GQ43DRAFT_412803 [Delitschia confertaspora ATCC 74209]
MALVNYSDSDEEDNEQSPININTPVSKSAPAKAIPVPSISDTQKVLKRKQPEAELSSSLPPLPAAFHDLYSTNTRISTRDDPSLHGGRKRAVPHVQGHWPSHVYLEWHPSHTESASIQDLIDFVHESFSRLHEHTIRRSQTCPEIHSSLRSLLGAPLPLHISLSRTLQIPTDERNIFLETITRCLRDEAVKPFTIRFSGLKWVPNFERNRWFLVLGIAKPEHDELNRLLDACNDAAQKTGHSLLYVENKAMKHELRSPDTHHPEKRRKNSVTTTDVCLSIGKIDRTARFHVSIAWALTKPPKQYNDLLMEMDIGDKVTSPKDLFQVVKVKIGNAIHNIELGSRKAVQEKGIGLLG